MELQYKCSRCKGFFSKNDVLKYSTGTQGNKQYYHCRKCNTERAKKYRHTLKGGKVVNENVYRSQKKWKNKQNAREKMNYALSIGKIIKPHKCEHCLKVKIVEGHHFDYEKPLEVVWVCRKCHSLIHRNLL